MFINRTISAGIGVLTAMIVVVVFWYLNHIGWLGTAAGQMPALVAAAVIGMVVALIVGMLLHRIDNELDQLCTHIENLGQREEYTGEYASGLWLNCIVDTVKTTTDKMRSRIDQLSAQRRDLESHSRAHEAELAYAWAVLNSMADAVFVTNAFDEIALANDAALAIMGVEQSELRRTPIDQLIANKQLLRKIREMREGGLPAGTTNHHRRIDMELTDARTHRRASYQVLLTAINPRSDAGPQSGELRDAGVVVVLRDVTREKAIAEQKSDFVSSVSHELRTPLSSIRAYLEMLVDGEATDADSRHEFYGIMQGETNRLSRLIDNLLDINRIESGAVTVQRELISLSQIVGEVLDVMAPQARAKNITLTGDNSPKYAQVFADRDLINQAVMNLIGNAIKYTPEGGNVEVQVSLDRERHVVQLSVRDTGIGIPETDLPRLFEKFYRVNDHKNVAAGTGLGLNLVKQIIETVHGGQVCVESRNHHGSTFTFALPIAENDY